MGLYDRVISYIHNNHPGLLKLAESELENNPVVIFNKETRKLNIKKACILVCNDNYYRLFLSTGFSSDNLADSVSTADFWDGTLPVSDWFFVTHENAAPYLQLFSKDDISDISKLHIKRFTASDIKYIFIAAETENDTGLSVEPLDSLISSFSNFIAGQNG